MRSAALSCGEFPKEQTFGQAVVHTSCIQSQIVPHEEGENAWHFDELEDLYVGFYHITLS